VDPVEDQDRSVTPDCARRTTPAFSDSWATRASNDPRCFGDTLMGLIMP
jgi:hypothetical protein